MKFLEKNLESIIFETDNSILQSKGLDIKGVKSRQKKIGNYGRIDLVSCQEVDNSFLFTIYELKKDKITDSSILQCLRYKKGFISYLESINFWFNFSIKLVIIGQNVDLKSELLLSIDLIRDFNGNRLIDVYTYKYESDGILFEKGDCLTLINEGF